ncbi:DNA-binding protein [Bacteroides pyogenes]|uniref:DNA-binding protein n=1 Tax=Bacteroides pyogenes TaxID=310300 RepID=UPI002FDA6C78
MVIRRYPNEMEPERTYSISEAARYLGVHRCTLYAYINHPEHPLPFVKVPETGKLMFYGRDLTVYKATGLPKRGRKRKNRIG